MWSSLTSERRPATTTLRKGSRHLLTLLMTLSLIVSSLANPLPLPIESHSNLLKSPVKPSSNDKPVVADKPVTDTNNPLANAAIRPAIAGHPRPLSRRPSSFSSSSSQSLSQPQPQDPKTQGKAQFKQFAASPPQPQPDPQPTNPLGPTSTTSPLPSSTNPLLPEHKYFHEPGYTESLSHYDSRFFSGETVAYAPHIIHLRRLIRSYLLMTSSLDLKTWLAHGTLLGWYWNGEVMPWDYDLDVQVSNKTLGEMGESWNGTVWEYVFRVREEEEEKKKGGEEGEGEGIEEARVGAGVRKDEKREKEMGKKQRQRMALGGDGGRGLMKRAEEEEEEEEEEGIKLVKREDEGNTGEEGNKKAEETRAAPKQGELRTKKYMLDVNPYWSQRTRLDGLNIIDARWIDMENGMYVDITGLSEDRLETAKQTGSGKGTGVGVWTDKNYHGYVTKQIWPLRKTEFEGVEAWVPFDVDGVLQEEYGGKSLTVEEYAGHYFDHGRKKWVKTELV